VLLSTFPSGFIHAVSLLQIGAKMLAANRSYRARISYLPAEPDQLAAAGKVCNAGHLKLERLIAHLLPAC